MKKYNKELKEEIIRLHLEEGRNKKSLTQEYELGQGTLSYWLERYRAKPENKAAINEAADKSPFDFRTLHL
jgi:transposase